MFMFCPAIAMGVIALPLFLLLLNRKPGRIKPLPDLPAAAAALAAIACFLLMRRASGNPDQGRALTYIIPPCAVLSGFGSAELPLRGPQPGSYLTRREKWRA